MPSKIISMLRFISIDNGATALQSKHDGLHFAQPFLGLLAFVLFAIGTPLAPARGPIMRLIRAVQTIIMKPIEFGKNFVTSPIGSNLGGVSQFGVTTNPTIGPSSLWCGCSLLLLGGVSFLLGGSTGLLLCPLPSAKLIKQGVRVRGRRSRGSLSGSLSGSFSC